MLQLAIEEEYSNEKEPKIEFPAEDPPIQEVKEENTGHNVSNSWYSSAQANPTITEASLDRQWNTNEIFFNGFIDFS